MEEEEGNEEKRKERIDWKRRGRRRGRRGRGEEYNIIYNNSICIII